MNKKILKKGLIVGPSGIGNVHFREFLRNGFNNIAFIGKSKFKKRTFNITTNKIKNFKLINIQNFANIKKFKPEVTSICSPFTKHKDHILKCKKYSKYLIVEKPFLWSAIKLKKDRNFEIASNLLANSNNKIAVNLPMVSLAKQLILKKEAPSIVRFFKFSYFTKGKQTYENIAVDLLPHALSFILTILKKSTVELKIFSIKKQKLEWSCRIKINETLCIFQFKQDILLKESILKFNINKDHYKRFQKDVKKERLNYLLKNKKKIIYLKNPMTDYLYYLLKSFKKPNNIKKNNKLVLIIMKLKENLLNFTKVNN